MHKAAILVVLLGTLSLAACVSGRPKQDVYTGKSGVTQAIESDREACERSCNNDYARCGDSDAARRSIDSTQGLFGASAGCSSSLSGCLTRCKGR